MKSVHITKEMLEDLKYDFKTLVSLSNVFEKEAMDNRIEDLFSLIDELQVENAEYKRINEVKDDHLVRNGKEIMRREEERAELISLNLWSARRLHKAHKKFAYDELDKIANDSHERL